jgi:hypothetical protein
VVAQTVGFACHPPAAGKILSTLFAAIMALRSPVTRLRDRPLLALMKTSSPSTHVVPTLAL